MLVVSPDLKFTSCIYTKMKKARQLLSMIKRTLFKASEKARLLACRPDVEYAAAVWDPNLEYITHDIELVQHNVV